MPCPVVAKRIRAASIRAWTARSRRARSRTAAGRKNTRRITAQACAGPPPRGGRYQVPHGPCPAWPRSRDRRFPDRPVPQERKLPPEPQVPEGRPRAIEGGRDRRTCFKYSFTGAGSTLPQFVRRAAATGSRERNHVSRQGAKPQRRTLLASLRLRALASDCGSGEAADGGRITDSRVRTAQNPIWCQD